MDSALTGLRTTSENPINRILGASDIYYIHYVCMYVCIHVYMYTCIYVYMYM
jgi:hypothetical protein